MKNMLNGGKGKLLKYRIQKKLFSIFSKFVKNVYFISV